MPRAKSLLLFVSCWLLVATTIIPSDASEASGMPVSDEGMAGSVETFPIIEDQVAVRQAHLAYLAAKEQIGMQATIRFIGSHGGSTGTLTSLMQKTGSTALAISSAGSETVLDAELENLRRVTGAFRQETSVQMTAINGNHDELRAEIQSDIAGNTELRQILDRYWSIRETTDLADFDRWMAKSQESLAGLRENGHEITPAQEKLKEIITMRTALATALRTRNNAGIELAHKKIHATSVEYARMISTIRISSSTDSRLGQSIDQGIGVITRARMMNADLKQSGVDITDPENLVALGKIQILTAQDQFKNNDTAQAKASLAEFRITLRTLRDTYRGILVQEDLSQTTAEGVLSVAQSLDVTAGQVAAY